MVSGIKERVWYKTLAFGQEPYREAALPAAMIAVAGALGLALSIWFAVIDRAGWGLDFNQFYSASRLAGTGRLYDFDALRKIEAQNGLEVPLSRLPVVVYGYKIFARVPYAVARSIWTACGIAALIVFAIAWPGSRPLLMLVALTWQLSTALVVLYGQDVPFWVLFFASGLQLIERKKPWIAGAVFSLCICKFHLALGIPVMLAARKCWSTMIAGAVAVLALIASCFLIEGPGWLLEYAKASQMPGFSPAPERMPNLHGITSWLPWPEATEIAAAVVIVLLLWTACRAQEGWGMAGAAAAACGLLLGHHAYAGDCTLLIPLSVLTIQRQGVPPWLRVWAILMLTPIPVLLIVSQKPFMGQMLVVTFVVAAITWEIAGRVGAESSKKD